MVLDVDKAFEASRRIPASPPAPFVDEYVKAQHIMGEMIGKAELSRCSGAVEELFEAIPHYLNAAYAGQGPDSTLMLRHAEHYADSVRRIYVGKRVLGLGTSDESINRSLGVVESFDLPARGCDTTDLRFVVNFTVELNETPSPVPVVNYHLQARKLSPVRRVKLKYTKFVGIGPPLEHVFGHCASSS